MLPSTARPLSFRAPGAGTWAGYLLLRPHTLLSAQLLRAFCVCAWPLAAPAVALAYAKYSFWKDLFSLIGWSPSSQTWAVRERGKANHVCWAPPGPLHAASVPTQPRPLPYPLPPACPEDDTCCVDSGQPVSGWLWEEMHQSLQVASVGHGVSL